MQVIGSYIFVSVCLYSFYYEKTSVDKPLLEYMTKKLNTR